MKTLKISIILLVCLFFFACNPNNDIGNIKLGETFSLDFEEEIIVEDFTIEFIDVVEESRCPIDARCFWAGQVIVALNINGEKVEMPPFHQDAATPSKDTIDNFIFTIEDVTPYPGLVGSEIIKADYEIKMSVEEL